MHIVERLNAKSRCCSGVHFHKRSGAEFIQVADFSRFCTCMKVFHNTTGIQPEGIRCVGPLIVIYKRQRYQLCFAIGILKLPLHIKSLTAFRVRVIAGPLYATLCFKTVMCHARIVTKAAFREDSQFFKNFCRCFCKCERFRSFEAFGQCSKNLKVGTGFTGRIHDFSHQIHASFRIGENTLFFTPERSGQVEMRIFSGFNIGIGILYYQEFELFEGFAHPFCIGHGSHGIGRNQPEPFDFPAFNRWENVGLCHAPFFGETVFRHRPIVRHKLSVVLIFQGAIAG